MATLSSLLRRYRKQANLTQKQLSERMNFHHSVISRVERNNSGYLPSNDFIETFSKSLNLSTYEKRNLKFALETARDEHKTEPIKISTLYISPSLKWVFLITFIFIGILTTYYFLYAPSPAPTVNSYEHYQRIPIGGVLYNNDFENQVISDWAKLNNGTWDIFDIGNNYAVGVRDQDPDAIPNIYLRASDEWVNYSVTIDVEFTSGLFEQIYIVVRSARDPNCSGYRIGGNRLGVSIFRFDIINNMCEGETIAEDIHYPLISGEYNMRVDVVGNKIQYFINDELILSASDSNYLKGGFGFLAYQVKEAYFDNIVVTKIGE
jgi:transcriptional regulator with XRE-family HTH domain